MEPMTLILGLTFLAATTLALAVGFSLAKSPVRERIDRLRGISRDGAAGPRSILVDDRGSMLSRTLARIGRRRGVDPSDPDVSKTRMRLIHAGYRRPSSLHVYYGTRLALAVLLPVLVFYMPFYLQLDASKGPLLLAMAAAFGLVVPSYMVDRRMRKRQLDIEHALPDALDLMVVCIESGLALTAGIARVAAEFARSRPVLAEEFELVALEVHAGKSNVEALRGLADRTGVAEVSALAAMLIQTERFGTSIADALRVHADAMRRRRIQRAEEAAAKAPVKMLFPAGLFIFPATLIFIAGPGVLKLISALSGQ